MAVQQCFRKDIKIVLVYTIFTKQSYSLNRPAVYCLLTKMADL